MPYIGVLKRVIPFFLTFAAGLFIASFFINITTPSFSFPRKSYKYREMHRLRQENHELRRSNNELRRQLDDARRSAQIFTLDGEIPMAPPPPPPPPAPRAPRFDR